MKKQVIIVGAGASGLAAAIAAGKGGARVTVLEHTDAIGKKLLSTGNGKCNFCNTDLNKTHYHSFSDPKGVFLERAFQKFGCSDTLKLFRSIGIVPRTRTFAYDDGGYVYPASGEAKSVLTALREEAAFYNTSFLMGCQIRSVAYWKDREGRPAFQLDTTKGQFQADALILAGGSCAMPKTGSDGSSIELPGAFGHTIWEFLPSLCALHCVGSFFRDLKGVRCTARLLLEITAPNKKTEAVRKEEQRASGADHFGFLTDDMLRTRYESYGEVQFTEYGVSGIPAFQLSRYVATAVKLRRERYLTIDFLPDLTEKALFTELSDRASRFADRTAALFLNGLLPEKLGRLILKKAGIREERGIYTLTEEELLSLVRLIHSFRISVLDTNGFDSCQCCAGGVDTREINSETMESELMPELFFAGELIDVDGDCGGYNLQWAWTSGTLSGRAAAEIRRYRSYPERFPTGAEEGEDKKDSPS